MDVVARHVAAMRPRIGLVYGLDVPLVIAVSFTLIGSLAMLFYYDTVLGVAAAAIAIPQGSRRSPGCSNE